MKNLPPMSELHRIAEKGQLSEEEQRQIDDNPHGRMNMRGLTRQQRVIHALILKVSELERRLDSMEDDRN